MHAQWTKQEMKKITIHEKKSLEKERKKKSKTSICRKKIKAHARPV